MNPRATHSIDLNIEELVLTGFAESDGQAVGAAISTELERLLAENGSIGSLTAAVLGSGSSPLAAEIDYRPGLSSADCSPPEMLGRQIAQAVYGLLASGPASAVTGNHGSTPPGAAR